MNNAPFRAKFNWVAIEGDVARHVSYNIQANETTNPIPQEKLLNPDACIVLVPDPKTEFCEQTISVNPVYQITKLALLAECRRIESFVGKAPEYYQTHHGELVFDDGTELFRFDIQFEVCGTAELILRYITPAKGSLCLYGTHLILEKNSNPLGMFASDSTLNRAMIDLRVNDSKLSEKAARCKQFVLDSMALNGLNAQKLFQNMMNYNIANSASSAGPTTSAGRGGSTRPARCPPENDCDEASPLGTSGSSFGELVAKQYMDAKFAALEAKIDAKLEALESRQNQKLDEILTLLKSISTK
ncbi:AAEL010412-PA [Aedes aegypti]|uniref:AAEL010412-PA n=1 Tax=Aedes aegypti TaxID=7159 RepID=Q16T17_AEDAE|nr:AAEL010412-PA [Aedes aegypti]